MAVTTHRGVDVSVVKTFLRGLREGRIYIARITRSGRNGKYAYLLPPLELIKAIGAKPGDRFTVKVAVDHVDYLLDEERGEYKLIVRNRGAQIRFPVDAPKGYVVIEPLPRGFRVYF